MTDATPLLARLPESFTYAEAIAVGLSRHVLGRLVQAGTIERVRHGVYEQTLAPPEQRWQQLVQDHLQRSREELSTRPGHAVSHLSAALLHGLPVLLHPEAAAHLTCIDRAPQSRQADGVQIHHCDSMENETSEVDGVRVTTLPRTLADVARTQRPRVSVPVIDAAVAAARTGLDEIRGVLDQQVRWRGRPRAYASLTLVDARRESWLESFSFVTFHDLGLPLPVPQVEVYDAGRQFIARLDGMLPDGVALEADGMGKYLIDVPPDETAEAVAARLAQQNARQLRVERLGLTVVRWTRREAVHAPEHVVHRIRAAQRRSSFRDFTGWLRIDGHWWRP